MRKPDTYFDDGDWHDSDVRGCPHNVRCRGKTGSAMLGIRQTVGDAEFASAPFRARHGNGFGAGG
jgi:hypothetical protein